MRKKLYGYLLKNPIWTPQEKSFRRPWVERKSTWFYFKYEIGKLQTTVTILTFSNKAGSSPQQDQRPTQFSTAMFWTSNADSDVVGVA